MWLVYEAGPEVYPAGGQLQLWHSHDSPQGHLLGAQARVSVRDTGKPTPPSTDTSEQSWGGGRWATRGLALPPKPGRWNPAGLGDTLGFSTNLPPVVSQPSDLHHLPSSHGVHQTLSQVAPGPQKFTNHSGTGVVSFTVAPGSCQFPDRRPPLPSSTPGPSVIPQGLHVSSLLASPA